MATRTKPTNGGGGGGSGLVPTQCFDTYYMVAGRGVPVFQHPTYEDAKREAERLLEKDPGQVFTILKAVASVRRGDPEWSVGA